MTFRFRSTSPQDAPEVAAFLRRVFEADPGAPVIAPQHLYWKCWEERSDWPGSRGYVVTDDGVIVAHGTVVPLVCLSGEQRLRMVHVIDWAADPLSPGSGITLMKQIVKLVDAAIIVGGSETAQKVTPALGFKDRGYVARFVRPLRPLRRIAGQKPSLRLGAQFARSCAWALQAPRPRVRGWSADRVAPAGLDRQAMFWPRAANGATFFERTADTLAYLLKCPVTTMELWAVSKHGAVCGYFLLAHAPSQVRIADAFVDSADREDWRALIQLAVLQASQNADAAEVVSFGSDPTMCRALLDSGFHDRGKFAMRLLSSKGVQLRDWPIRFQMIDSDAAYLHQNREAYWA